MYCSETRTENTDFDKICEKCGDSSTTAICDNCTHKLAASYPSYRFTISDRAERPTRNTPEGRKSVSAVPTRNTPEGRKSFLVDGTPCYYQSKPRERDNRAYKGAYSYSHSRSKESFRRWASRECDILKQQHKTKQPTHFTTIKFNRVITLEQHSEFMDLLRRKLATQATQATNRQELAGYWKLEIEVNNCLHCHIFLRTTILEVRAVIIKAIERTNNKIFDGEQVASVDYFEPIKSVEGSSIYISKITKPCLLFKQEFEAKLVGQFGKYFDVSKDELYLAENSEFNAMANGLYVGENFQCLEYVERMTAFVHKTQLENWTLTEKQRSRISRDKIRRKILTSVRRQGITGATDLPIFLQENPPLALAS